MNFSYSFLLEALLSINKNAKYVRILVYASSSSIMSYDLKWSHRFVFQCILLGTWLHANCRMMWHDRSWSAWLMRLIGPTERLRKFQKKWMRRRCGGMVEVQWSLNDHDKYAERKWNEMNLMITTEIPILLEKHAC